MISIRRQFFGFCVAIFSTGIAYGEGVAKLNDVDGNIAHVPLSEVHRAYFESFQPLGTNHRETNGDGSIAIFNPIFRYAGKDIPFSSGYDMTGVCKYFGFLSAHGYEDTEFKGPLVMAKMNGDGSLDKVYHDRSANSLHYLVRVVVCSQRK